MSGGGGGAGIVDFPAYLKTVHNDWLDDTGVDTIEKSMTEVMDSALGSSPWNAAVAYDPDVPIAAYEAVIAAFAAILAGIVDTTSWAAFFTQGVTSVGVPPVVAVADKTATGITNPVIVADVAAFAADLDDNITVNVLPRFRRGMQDINAVVSSAFPIGEAIIEAFQARDVAKYDANIRLAAAIKNAEITSDIDKANLAKDVQVAELNTRSDLEYNRSYLEASSQILRLMLQRISWHEGYMKTFIEGQRIKIVAKKEEMDVNLQIGENDGVWDLNVFQYGSNLLAAIGGGTGVPRQPSTASSALGGAMSGAAAGAMVGGPAGALIGGVIGAAAGLLR